jgi:hypothetical protein
MAMTKQPQNTSTRPAARLSMLANAAVRSFNALSADRALAQRAATMAALPRQRRGELRALYVAHERALASVAVDKAARSRTVESSAFLSTYEEKRAASLILDLSAGTIARVKPAVRVREA